MYFALDQVQACLSISTSTTNYFVKNTQLLKESLVILSESLRDLRIIESSFEDEFINALSGRRLLSINNWF